MKRLKCCDLILLLVLIFSIALFFSIALCGCIPQEENPVAQTDSRSVNVYVDKETGVNYYTFHKGYAGGITVRVNADGSPYISEVEE